MHYLLIPYLTIFLLYLVFATKYNKNEARNGIVYILIIAIAFLCMAILMQPLEGDAEKYNNTFLFIRDLSFGDMIALLHPEFLYRLINWLVGQVTSDYHVLFFVLFIIFILVFYKALKNIFPTYDRYYIFITYILYPGFIAYLANTKRQGLALVFMLLAISYLFKNEKVKGTVALTISVLFHNTMLLVLLPIFLFSWLKEKNILKYVSIIYIISLIVSIMGLNELIQSDVMIEFFQMGARYERYVLGETEINYYTGFRFDFTLFSLLPIFIYFYFRTRIKGADKKRVKSWLGLYLLLSSIYQFLSFIPFSDRLAAFSWFMLPLVCYIVLESVSKKYAVWFTVLLLFVGVVLLQIYTSNYLLDPKVF